MKEKLKSSTSLPSGFDDDLPDWATRFHVEAWSASGSARPNCREFFEKVIARPQRLYSPPGCRMLAGLVAERYAVGIVVNNEDPATAFRAAVSDFDNHEIVKHDESDAPRFATIRDEEYTVPGSDPAITGTVLELTCKHTAEGLAEATRTANLVEDGRWISVYLEGVELPFIGQIDVESGAVVEIKTRWPTLTTRAKRGWQINSLPAKPDPNHIAQVALYWRWLRQQSENVPVQLVYANCKGYRVFDSSTCDELAPSSLEAALDRLRAIARTRESLMKAAATTEELFSMVPPDFAHFMWSDCPPEYMAVAKQQWGL